MEPLLWESKVEMARNNSDINADKVGWRVNEWAADVGVGPAFTYELLNAGRIRSVKLDGARIITTRSADFLASLDETPAPMAAPVVARAAPVAPAKRKPGRPRKVYRPLTWIIHSGYEHAV